MSESEINILDGKLEIRNLIINNSDIVSYFENMIIEKQDLIEVFERLLKLGILSSKSTQIGDHTDYIDKKFLQTINQLREHVEEHFNPEESIRNIFNQLMFEVGIAKGGTQEHLRGTQKGFDFEHYCEHTISDIAKIYNDRLEKTGDSTGFVENSKKGDYVYSISENDKKIVLEMKDYTHPQSTPALERYLDEAMNNRGTDYAIVISKSAQGFSKEVGMFQEYGNKLFVALTPADSENSELHRELIIIAIKWARQKLLKKTLEFDSNLIQEKISSVQRTIKKLSNLKTKCTSIANISNDISDEIDKLQTDIKDDLQEITKSLK